MTLPLDDSLGSALVRIFPCLLALALCAFVPARRALGLAPGDAVIAAPVLGLAGWVVVQGLLDAADVPLFPWLAPLVALALVGVGVIARPRARESREARGHLPLVLVVLASFAFLLVPATWQALPPGWDPAFHSLVAELVAARNALPSTWEPFERIPLTMPAGLHGWLAAVHDLTGVPTPRVFQVMLAVGVAWSAGLVGLIASSDSRQAAIWAAVIYAFGASYCALDYIRWGGLTNAWGMALLLTGLWLLLADSQDAVLTRRREMAGGLLIGLVGWVHHHAMLAAGLLLGVTALLEPPERRSHRPSRWIRVLAVTGLALVPPAFHFLSRAGSVGRTGVFGYRDELWMLRSAEAIVSAVGIPLLVSVVIFVVTWRSTAASRLVTAWAGALLAAFVAARYGYGWWTKYTTGEPAEAFSAVRFFSDAVYFLAMAGGIGMARLQSMQASPLQKRTIAAALVVACLAHAGWWLVQRHKETTSPAVLTDMQWIRDHTEPSALVVSEFPWLPALTGRESTYTPLPASEPQRTDSVMFKRMRLAHDPAALAAWSRENGRPVYLHLRPFAISPSLDPCFEEGHTPIYRLRATEADQCPDAGDGTQGRRAPRNGE
jgi:uncharacterized protein DUF6541